MSATRETTIYALSDPATGAIRYVGKTCVGLKRRLAQHRRDNRRSTAPVCRWVAKICATGAEPGMISLEVVPPGGPWEERERFWIRFFADRGPLLNVARGGAGSPADRRDDEETLRKKREAQALVRKRPGFQERVNAGLRRHWSDPAARQAQTDRLNERYKDPEARAKCAAVPKGGKLPAEWVANISAGKRASGYSPSEETRRKISETLMARGDPWAKAREAKARKATAASE